MNPTSLPSPKPSASPKPTSRTLPLPNSFGRHTNSSASLPAPSRTSSLDLSSLPTEPSDSEPLALHTVNTQRAIIKDLKFKILKYHADKMISSNVIRKLERANQQLHQEAIWREREIGRLERRLAVREGFVERSEILERISKRLAVEVTLAEEEGRTLEDVEMCKKGNLII